jgi:uroporphyrinogen decarboxylase
MRRLPFDAAIVFADILLIPRALGQDVRFEAGRRPKLGPLPAWSHAGANRIGGGTNSRPSGRRSARVRAALEPERALIGFAGAPWTVLTYMLEGGGSRDRETARRAVYEQPELVEGLLEVLVEATAGYLAMQAAAGAQVLKLFDAGPGDLPEACSSGSSPAAPADRGALRATA